MKKNTFSDGGFRFRVLDVDYDFCRAKARCRYNRQNWQRAIDYKERNEHDFTYKDYDCTGSTCLRINVKRKGKHMFVWFWWSKDV